MIVPRDKACDVCSGTHETHKKTSLSAISIENPPNSIPHQRINRFKQVFAMDEYLSSTESEKTAKVSSQDEFDNIEVEATERETSRGMRALKDDSLKPYTDKPLADEEWLRVYREKRQLAKELKKR